MFVPGRPFEPSLMFVGKAKSLPLNGALGKIPELLANIRLGWKGLLGTNTNLLQIFLNYRCKNVYNIVYRLKNLQGSIPLSYIAQAKMTLAYYEHS
jgi:hypothetical protein